VSHRQIENLVKRVTSGASTKGIDAFTTKFLDRAKRDREELREELCKKANDA
jgi:hypothetical protein